MPAFGQREVLGVVGQTAMGELMNNADVMRSMSSFEQHIDQEKIGKVISTGKILWDAGNKLKGAASGGAPGIEIVEIRESDSRSRRLRLPILQMKSGAEGKDADFISSFTV